MKNLWALLKLDITYIKTYWPWTLMFIGIAVIFGLSFQQGIGFMVNLSVFMVVITLFPYESADKGLDILYGALPTNRKSIVTGRFLFLLLVLLVFVAVGLLGGMAIDFGFHGRVHTASFFTGLAVSVGVYLVFVAWNAPFLFKFGYIKGRIFFWAFVGVIILVLNFSNLLQAFGVEDANRFNIFAIAFRNFALSSIISLSAGLSAFVLSFFLSQKVYKKKDF